MSEALTLRDCINEAKHFNHSKEHFELMKECEQLMLMRQYLADQQYMAEEVDSSLLKSMTESGYFIESVNEEGIEKYTEGVVEKAKNIGKKIWAGIKKLIRMVIAFVKKIWTKIKKTFINTTAKLHLLKLSKIDPAKIPADKKAILVGSFKEAQNSMKEELGALVKPDLSKEDSDVKKVLKLLSTTTLVFDKSKLSGRIISLTDLMNITRHAANGDFEKASSLLNKAAHESKVKISIADDVLFDDFMKDVSIAKVEESIKDAADSPAMLDFYRNFTMYCADSIEFTGTVISTLCLMQGATFALFDIKDKQFNPSEKDEK